MKAADDGDMAADIKAAEQEEAAQAAQPVQQYRPLLHILARRPCTT